MIFTGSYRDVENLLELGWKKSDLVGISWGRVKNVDVYVDELKCSEELFKNYLKYKKLYGGLWLSDFKREYEIKFKKYLLSLDVDFWGKKLDGKILLCYEKSGEFCHRNFVRQWFNYFGYSCVELWCN